MRQLPLCFINRETQKQVYSSVLHRSLPECGEGSLQVLIEIAPRNFRVTISFASQEPPNVSAIFAEQRPRVVFRMPLKKNELALPLLNEHVRTHFGRPRKDLIAPRSERLFGQLVVSGMREAPSRWHPVQDRMVCNLVAIEDSGKLLPEWTTAYTIGMKDRSVCCKA
jgi:hypothetical protein